MSFWQEHGSGRRIVDLGCGSGFFCFLLHHLGIPKHLLLAVDLPQPSHDTDKYKPQWNIHREENYRIAPSDILFVAWGSGVKAQVDQYVQDGGDCVIILGEADCTFDCGYFDERADWDVAAHHVMGPASPSSEYLTFNQKKASSCPMH